MNNKRLKLRMSMLTPIEKSLVIWMQRIAHGRIENLVVRNSQPVLPAEGILVNKLGVENRPRPEIELADFALKQEVCDLLQQIREMKNGIISLIKISHGLPIVTERAVAIGFDE